MAKPNDMVQGTLDLLILKALGTGELHGLGDGGGEVDVPLLAAFTLNELNFSWASHIRISSHITRYKGKKNLSKQWFYLVAAKLQGIPPGCSGVWRCFQVGIILG